MGVTPIVALEERLDGQCLKALDGSVGKVRRKSAYTRLRMPRILAP